MEACKYECFVNPDCDAVDWYAKRYWYKDGNWGRVRGGKPNCILKENTAGDQSVPRWITASSGHKVTKKRGGLKNAVVCVAKNSAYFGTTSTTSTTTTTTGTSITTTTTTTTIAEPTEPTGSGSDDDAEPETTTPVPETESTTVTETSTTSTTTLPDFAYLGEGGCRAGFQNSKSFVAYKHMNVDGFDQCVKNCMVNFVVNQLSGDPDDLDSYFVHSLGLEFRPNIPFLIPDGKWRKKTKAKPNCVCLKKTKTRRGKAITEVTGTTGARKKDGPTKASYTQCFKRISPPSFARQRT